VPPADTIWFVDEDSFWAFIAECRERSANDTELMSRVMFRRLRALSAEDVDSFARHWERARSWLYSWPVTDAACLMLGTVEEEHLRFVQDWVISFGRAAAATIARDPDSLADLSGDFGRARAAWFCEFITEAHIVTTGGTWPLRYDPEGPGELTGEHLDLGDHAAVEQHFPRLAAFRRDHPGLSLARIV
jgi:uncharacterized protein DUF4240